MKSKSNITQLIASCKKQEWSAQKELYLLYADEMMSIAIRYSSDPSSAKDLVQDTFFTFFKRIHQFDSTRGTLGAYLSRILINRAFVTYRNSQKMQFDNEDILLDQVADETSAIEALEAEDILRLLKDLPQGCRIIFNLKVVEGYNHNEIGKMLGITPSASRSQLTRAKKLLRDMIGEREHINISQVKPNTHQG